MISLLGEWRFAQGDDASWSRPDYDDAAWEVLPVPDIWIVRGLPGSGIGWYRTWIVVNAADSVGETSIWVKGLVTAGEVYLDGVLVGRRGLIQPQQSQDEAERPKEALFSLGNLLTPGKHLLALRVANFRFLTGGIDEAPKLGLSHVVLLRMQRTRAVFGFLGGVFILSAIHLLILFAGGRDHKEHLYFALLSFAGAVLSC